jgi:hypothetical protein
MSDNTSLARRRSERQHVEMTVTLVIEGDEAEYLATAVDVSQHGLRLQSGPALAPGQPVGLLFPTDPASFIRARVVWVGKADSIQNGQTGFEFLNLSTGPVS